MAFWKFFPEEDRHLLKYPKGQQQLYHALKNVQNIVKSMNS